MTQVLNPEQQRVLNTVVVEALKVAREHLAAVRRDKIKKGELRVPTFKTPVKTAGTRP